MHEAEVSMRSTFNMCASHRLCCWLLVTPMALCVGAPTYLHVCRYSLPTPSRSTRSTCTT